MIFPRFTLLFQVCCVHLISHIHMLVLPVLMPMMLLASDDLSFVQIGLAISVFNIVAACIQAPTGFFVDKIGPKRVLFYAVLLGSVSFISLGFFSHYIWLLIAMGLIGVAHAVYHPADYAILSQNVTEKRMGRAFSLHTFSGYVGFAITPVLMVFMVKLSGISAAFLSAGIIGLFGALVLLPKSKDELNQSSKQKVEQKPETVKTTAITTKYHVFTPTIFFMLILFLLLNLSTGSIQNFSVSALVTGYSISLTDANVALTAFLIASSVGVLAGGSLADYSKQHGLIASGALFVTAFLAAIVAMFTISNVIVLTFIIGLIGFLSGLIAPSRDMLVRSVSPKGAEGRVFGIVSTGFNIGGAVGPIIFAWILDHGYPRGIFWSAAIFMVLTALLAIYQDLKGKKNQ